MRATKVVAALVAVIGTLVVGAPSAQAVSLDCRARYAGSWANGTRFAGKLWPTGPRPEGDGHVMQLTNDGTLMLLHAKTLFCRRDGGDVPAHGGANVADATGSALILGNRGPVKVVNFQLHLEDRGTAMRPEGGSSDFYALRLSDDADNELYLDANYFATGGVELTPTDVPSH